LKYRDKLWHQWQTEVLHTWTKRPKWVKEIPNLKVGQIVAVRHCHMSPFQWPVGEIIRADPDKNGIVRTITVRTLDKFTTKELKDLKNTERKEDNESKQRELTRHVSAIAPLPCDTAEELPEKWEEVYAVQKGTRIVDIGKPPIRINHTNFTNNSTNSTNTQVPTTKMTAEETNKRSVTCMLCTLGTNERVAKALIDSKCPPVLSPLKQSPRKKPRLQLPTLLVIIGVMCAIFGGGTCQKVTPLPNTPAVFTQLTNGYLKAGTWHLTLETNISQNDDDKVLKTMQGRLEELCNTIKAVSADSFHECLQYKGKLKEETIHHRTKRSKGLIGWIGALLIGQDDTEELLDRLRAKGDNGPTSQKRTTGDGHTNISR